MGGDNLDVLMPRAAVPVFILDTGVRKPDVTIVVRQLVLTRPSRDLRGLAIRPPVALLLASIALVQKALIVALELVVEDDAPNATALAAETLLGRVGSPDDVADAVLFLTRASFVTGTSLVVDGGRLLT